MSFSLPDISDLILGAPLRASGWPQGIHALPPS
jgi:hypothetical protein